MTHIYFIRHAHSTYTPEERERPLSEKGRNDAQTVTDLLKGEKIDVVISSPYKRATQTIQGVADQFELPVQIEEDLRERLLSKEPVEDFEEAIMKVWGNPVFSFEGGESNNVAQKRGVTCIQSILKQHEGKNIVIGTHGNIMVLIMNYFDSKYDLHFWKELEMPDIYNLTFNEEKLISAVRIETSHLVNNL
ncbi:histidine phosphatase family protein [Bacillus sp. XF8]|uniref:histidine phosphatase family protein n=1 Tax=Bacillus sp. XF8 TaxID=2819289 RepID=UPI001AA038BD|nr:histidine phosphatase family protein [Bacillus sp. XF8]MBO1578536.1 histidine phosphatase family protein [Bacillus sp. XF8]